jgi:membrane protein required for colicin V production
MNTLDIILAILLFLFAYKGFTNGFIIGVATLLGLVAGLWCALHFSDYSAHVLRDIIHFHTTHMALASFTFTFFAILILIFLLGKLLTGIINLMALGLLNRLAGALFGIAKGCLILSASFYILVLLDTGGHLISHSQRNGSKLYKPIAAIFPALLPLVKEKIFNPHEPAQDTRSDNQAE